MSRNIFVVGLDEANHELLRHLPAARECRFHPLIDFSRLRGVDRFPIAELLAEAERTLDGFDGPVDGICTCIDFPATELASLLGRRYGLPGPSLEGVLACNHKHWSRRLQRAAVPWAVPPFTSFDPYAADPLSEIDLDYPLWIKPLNAYRSHLGFRINHPQDFHAALPIIREQLPRLAEPLDVILKHAALPADVAAAGSRIMLAEEVVSGQLCTVEGYVRDGRPHVYGIVDSVRAPNRSSFARYQYPSTLPARVQHRITGVTERVMRAVGLDQSPFNLELFYEPAHGTIRILEINPRLSQSHARLFEMVDGTSHLQVMVDLALGRTPSAPFAGAGPPARGRGLREGPFTVAAKFFLRAYRDAVVEAVPGEDDIARLQAALPGVSVNVLVAPGAVLSDLPDQDAYSYELAEISLGARSRRDLLARWRLVRESLPFGLSDP